MARFEPSEPYRPPTRKQIAFHEAGHAVVARLLGLTVTNVTIEVRGYAGVETDAGLVDPSTLRRERAIMLLASDPAQQLAGPIIDHGYSTVEDLLQVEDMFPDEADQADLRLEAIRLVAGHQTEIVAVAEALLRRRRLNMTELDAIIARAQERVVPNSESEH